MTEDTTMLLPGIEPVTATELQPQQQQQQTPPEPQAEQAAICAVPAIGVGLGAGFPNAQHLPCYRTFDEAVEHGGRSYGAGVWHFSAGKDGSTQPDATWICSPIHIEAQSRDRNNNHYGRLLRLVVNDTWHGTRERCIRYWAMPMEMMAGDGTQLRVNLLSMGVTGLSNARQRQLLAAWLCNTTPRQTMLCVQQLGWLDDKCDTFVLPDAAIGKRGAEVVFQSQAINPSTYATQGTVAQWCDAVSKLARGNPLLMAGICCAFAGALIRKTGSEPGGLHIVGDSSVGKSSILAAAASVWGGDGYKRTWKSTAVGMELTASLFNDGLFALDEIGECNPRDVGSIVYFLGNGATKMRGQKNVTARAFERVHCFALSTGERTIEEAIQAGGEKATGGQGVRLVNIRADGTHGAWNELHHMADGAAFSKALKDGAADCYGTVGRAYLERLCHEDDTKLRQLLRSTMEDQRFQAQGNQAKRVADRLALLAVAGELATCYALTGWETGEATEAAALCFQSWKDDNNGGIDCTEATQAVQALSDFLDRHGNTRFAPYQSPNTPINNLAGWYKEEFAGGTGADGVQRSYLMTSGAIREVLQGLNCNRSIKHLVEAGWIEAGTDKASQSIRLPDGAGVKRVYVVTPQGAEP